MRIKRHYILITIALITNFFVLLYLSSLLSCADNTTISWSSQPQRSQDGVLDKGFTIVIREFEDFDNTVSEMVAGLLDSLSGVDILVVADKLVYPPLKLPKSSRVHYVVLNAFPESPLSLLKPEKLIRTENILFLPDGVTSITQFSVKQMTEVLESVPNHKLKIVSGAVQQESLQCLNIEFDVLRWNLEYSSVDTHMCSGYEGKQAIMMRTQDFLNLSHPLCRPFPESLFIQTSLHGWKAKQEFGVDIFSTKTLFKDGHDLWKHKTLHKERLNLMYKKFGIKQAVHSDGKIEWLGCSKDTSRCFGTVMKDMPSYIWAKRWTPPCCLKNLRETVKHVVSIFEKEGVRYWLEGGSLLGAARHGDIIPWDFDVDISMYKEDIDRCKHLQEALSGAHLDEEGFVWEKATEGNFFRVQYSEVNHLHVDIWTFTAQNGIMKKGGWVTTHKQDVDFPEHFLKPLTKIQFAGINASAPNNVKEFLEFKFGGGVIENPRYPNQDTVS